MPEYVTPIVPSRHPLYEVVTKPDIVPVLLQTPLNDAAGGVKPVTWSHVIVTTGQVIVAGPAPVTLTMHCSLIAFPHASLPEYVTPIVPS